MPITATVSRSYSVRMIALAVLCLVFGVWGLYDYFIGIPAQQNRADRFDMLSKVREVFELSPGDDTFDQTMIDAKAAVQIQVDRLVQRNLPPDTSGAITEEQAEQLISSLQKNEDDQKLMIALAFLSEALAQPRSPTGVLTQEQMIANQIVVDSLAGMEAVTPPSGFDRAFQWVYILCLPFAPYFLWKWWKKYKHHYTLDEAGALHMPNEITWADDEITDIDMDRWMEKSLAYVIHRDGTRAELDDYYFQNMHLIVGHFAHKFHPEQWHEDARQIRNEEQTDDAVASTDAADDDSPRMPMA